MNKRSNSKTKHLELQDLMLYRVHEILLVASPYDAFILEEDGRLTEQILNEYIAMNFYQSPRLWRVHTGRSALDQLTKRYFDVIIVMLRLADMDSFQLCSKIKELYPDKHIILLIFDAYEIEEIPFDTLYKNIDKVFVWTGKQNVFPAMMKYIEDKNNSQRDILHGGVRTIIFIEDNPRYYSMILPLLYKEIMFHTKKLVDKSLDATSRLIHLRGRTKVLLANTFEEAQNYFNMYRDNVLGIISDVRFPMKGKIDKTAGIQFTNFVRQSEPFMPVVIQSSNLDIARKAKAANADFLYKHSQTLLKDLRKFMLGNFGFGDFIFRDQKGETLAAASDIPALYDVLHTLPQESLLFHSKFNHFSNWLANRGEFKLASILRPVSVNDFDDTEDLRKYLIKSVKTIINIHEDKHIIDFSIDKLKHNIPFLRIGKGSLGGKARGLLFMNRIIADSKINVKFPDVSIRIPKAVVIGTTEFDKFMNNNNLLDSALTLKTNAEIVQLFLTKSLSRELVKILDTFLKHTKYPLAVRSSSLLEDSQFQPLAGLYSTFMLPNSSANRKLRLNLLREAIVRIYASTYFADPKALVENSSYLIEEEKMGIIIMEMVGQKFGKRFYPTFSGVARNINYYPISYMEREEGVASVALGLGKGVMEGEKSLRFSPKFPNILPQYYSINETIKTSQNNFYALDINPNQDLLSNGEADNLIKCSLEAAETDGQLFWSGSVVSADDNIIRDSLQHSGTRVITFAQILKWKQFPLSELLIKLLEIGRTALGNPVEIEFSVNLDRKNKNAEFCLLQIRPMSVSGNIQFYQQSNYHDDDLLCKSSVSLGNGSTNDIKDIVYVDNNNFDIAKTKIIAEEVELFNKKIGKKNPYLLIGPGRWGTADEWLGIPVEWNQISNAAAIVEIGMAELPIDPSFGTHFFQNIAGMRIGYFTIDHKRKQDCINHDNISNLPVCEHMKYVNWIRVKKPLVININGNTGEGIIALFPKDKMDEEKSSGI
ncbi:MAG: PEP/pyruvate-binding domain-containing protein [Candidatus Neomarinimicrobiota bacterium]